MVTLELPNPPLRLYRFRSLTRDEKSLKWEIDAIRNGYLYCSTSRNMNDPMEGFSRLSSSLGAQHRSAIKKVESVAAGIGIASLTETNANELMWAHYTTGYQGICVGYRTGRLRRGLSEDVHLARLAYGDEPPRVGRRDLKNINATARKLLSFKKDNWAYEREWRILAPRGPAKYGDLTCVTRIYFGARLAEDKKRELVGALRDLKIKFYEMKVTDYEHTFVAVRAEDILRKRA
jgi:Protein of unknown function (DUF2971)